MYESKSKMFGLALSPTEREAIRKLAQLEGGLSQAAVVRRLIVLEARRRGVLPQASEQTREVTAHA